MYFKQISQIIEFLANLSTVFGVSLISTISYFYKTRIYDVENYKATKSPNDIPKGELPKYFDIISNFAIINVNKKP